MTAYVIGHLNIRDESKWQEYRNQVPDTLNPWDAQVVLRGKHGETLAGNFNYSDTVVIKFPDREAIQSWYDSAAYQALIPVREAAADMVLMFYDE